MPSFVVALFLVAHGLIHLFFIIPQPAPEPGAPTWPFDLSRSRVLTLLGAGPRACRAVGVALLAVVVVGYVAAALGALGVFAGLFVPGVVAGSVASIAVLLLFFQPWLVLGLVIDAVLLWATLANGWRP